MSRRPQSFMLPASEARYDDICRVVDALQDLDAAQSYQVEIHTHASTRNARQNRTLWWIYEKILDIGGNTTAGYLKEELHEHFLGEYYGVSAKRIFGRVVEYPLRRSSKLSTAEFAKFVDFIYSYMASKGVVLPLPDRTHDWRRVA